MTESYILYLQTPLTVESVLQLIFEPKSIAPVDDTNLLYARGLVYLAHGQVLAPRMQERISSQFGFEASMSIRYFPDGVSSVRTAMDILADGIVRWLTHREDNLLLSVNNNVEVIRRMNGELKIRTSHAFLAQGRLKYFDKPYSEV